MIKSSHTNTVFWFAEMSSKSVTRLTVADNPEERAPLYPGKWSRNNLSGSALSKNEYLKEKNLRVAGPCKEQGDVLQD